MPGYHFRLPGRADKLGAWLALLFHDVDRSTRRRWVEESRVCVEGRVVDRLSSECSPGAHVEIADVPEESLASPPPGSHSSWLGLIDEPPWPGGALHVSEKQALEFSVGERQDGLAIVRLDGASCDAVTLARALARAEMPLVGDLERGGLGVAGGARLIVNDGRGSSSIDWPDEPAWMSADRETAMLSLQVSDETARAIRKGHPWILPDDASDSARESAPRRPIEIE